MTYFWHNFCKYVCKKPLIFTNMKKILLFLVTITLSLTACADNQQLVGYDQLPVVAQTFIRKYFNPSDVTYIKRERDGVHHDYNVYLKNSVEIDFDHQGNLESIDCNRSPVPEGIVPELITSFVSLHYPEQIIVEYIVNYRSLDVELRNGLDLVFDLEGHFVRVDD